MNLSSSQTSGPSCPPTTSGRNHVRILVVSVLLSTLSLTGCGTPGQNADRRVAQNHVEHAVLWRGFTHEWGYNHRLNRLGNYVTLAGCRSTPVGGRSNASSRCTGQAVHAAATGTGSDTGEFVSHFSTLRSDAITFTEGNVSLQFTGREQQLITDEAVLKIPLKQPLDTDDSHVVFLNGFDLRTRAGSKAKKLKHLRFSVDRQATTDHADEVVTFRVRGELNANCDSMECKSQKNRVRYLADLRWLMISADPLPRTHKQVSRSYKWDKKQELTRERLGPSPELVLKGEDDVPTAAVGWTEFGVDLGGYKRRSGKITDRDHWFVEWSLFLPPGQYRPESGTYRLQPDLFFKQWNRKTRRRTTSIARRGHVTLSGEVTMVQHDDLEVEHRSMSGQITWRGKSAAARTEKAVERQTFSF